MRLTNRLRPTDLVASRCHRAEAPVPNKLPSDGSSYSRAVYPRGNFPHANLVGTFFSGLPGPFIINVISGVKMDKGFADDGGFAPAVSVTVESWSTGILAKVSLCINAYFQSRGIFD